MMTRILLAMAWAAIPVSNASATVPSRCNVGVYRLAEGALVDIAPENDGVRWRTIDGRTGRLTPGEDGAVKAYAGWTKNPDRVSISFGACGSGTIEFEGKAGRLVNLEERDIQFESGGVKLAGRLVMPIGGKSVPVMVLGHGSERSSALINAFRQRLYPASGVGVFVYDKRGTGASGGKYTQDFETLAKDAAAAMTEARRLAGRRGSRFGFQGGSQAGWVLPLAAQKTSADFVIVGYGIAASPLIEDRTETLQGLTAKGWGPEVLAKATEVTDATGAVMISRFTGGYDRLRAAVAKYGREPWFKDLRGEFTGDLVKYPESVIRVEGPKRDEGTTWDFDALGSLHRLRSPLLWMIAAEDTEGPGEETKAALLGLQREGRPVTVAVFPNTEHGIHLVRTTSSGEREETGYAPDYFRMELDYARHGRLTKRYRSAELHLPNQ